MRLIVQAWTVRTMTATSITTRYSGLVRMPSETISVVAPAGGWLTRSSTMTAPVAASESPAAMISRHETSPKDETAKPWLPITT